jgi:hypothetical protein
VAAARQGATPAGDADPYRIPPGPAADDDEGEDDAGGEDAGGEDAGGEDPGDGRRPGDSAQRDGTVRETPAGGEQGAGYSRS